MTAPAAALTATPTTPAVPRPSPQAVADPFAFGAVLDSLPSTTTKAGASAAEEQQGPSNESPQDESSRGQTARHSLLNDSALLAALPFALRAASTMNERPQAAGGSPSFASPAMKGPKAAESVGSIGPGARTASIGRLIGERAFHFGAFNSAGAIANMIDAPFDSTDAKSAAAARLPRTEAIPAEALAAPPSGNALAPASTAPRANVPQTNRVSPTRAATHDVKPSVRKPEVSAPPPAARVASSAAPVARAESSSDAADGRPPDPTTLAAPPTPQTDLFGGQLPAPFAAGTSFQLDGSTAGAGQTDVTPRASALATGPAPSTPPIREIDVDLSPGGLEDVSMTMRLAGDKLSVVIRAASSQTLGSIEGARDAITDRLAAIGQPLDSLIVKQAGVNMDGNANGNTASAEDGSSGGERQSAEGARERGGSRDANLSRRGAGRDRSF